MVAYATRQDLFRYGLPRGLLANPGQLVGAVHTSSDAFELDQHGLCESTPVLFRAEAGGSLPTPISAGTTYYALPINDSLFQVSATPGGSPVNLSTAGESVVVATSREKEIDDALEHFSRLADSYLPAHAVPLEEPYPTVVIALVAELAAMKVLRQGGQESQAVEKNYDEAMRQLGRLMKGIPLRDVRATAPANLAVAKSAAADPRGWDLIGGLIP